MEESPWGAPDDSLAMSLPRPPSPKISISPPTSSFALSTPTWGGEDDAWGGGSSAYVPASTATTSFSDSGGYVPPAEDPPLPSFASATASHSEAWPTQDDSALSYGGLTGVRRSEEETREYGTSASPPLHSTDDFPLETRSSELYGQADETETPSHEEEKESDDRGWGGASPDLPPISSLRLASPPSPTADENAAGWSPEENDDFDTEPPPPPLPTVEEVFASAKPRRESVELKKAAEGGGDAWGSSQGWEERVRAEAEARAQERGDEPEPEKAEGEEASGAAGADAAPARSSAEGSRPAGGLSSILGRFRKGAEDTAVKSTEVAKDVADAASRTAGQLAQSASDAVAQAHDGDAKPAPAKSSWFGRKAKPADEPTPAAKKPVETKEEDPYTLGVEEVEMGGSGRALAEEPVQPSAIGRFFSRLKRAPSSNPDDDGSSDKATSPRASAEIAAGSIRPDDLDVLANGGLGASRTLATGYHEDDDFRPPSARSGLFGSRSKASAAQVPQAPPEDDFGGLIGALSAAPTRPPVRPGSGSSKAFDPFDPLSDSFGAVPAIPALNKPKSAPPTRAASTARAAGRPVAPLSPPPRPASARPASQISPPRAPTAVSSFRPQANTPYSMDAAVPRGGPQQPDDDFDDFFNAVTAPSASTAAVTQQRPSPQVATRLAPTTAPAAHPPLSAAARAAKARVAAPAPRMTISPPARNSTASPASSIGSATSARPTTPILPLPPPPPPSQPVAGNSARGLNILAPPPPPAGGGSSPSSALPSPTTLSAPASKPSLPPPLPLPLPRGMSSSPLAPSPTLSQGGKPLTPSATPNAQRAPFSGPLSMDDLSFFEA